MVGGRQQMGNGSDQGPPSIISFMLTQHSKLLWVGPAQNHLSMVGPDSYHFLLYLQCLGSFKLEPLKRGANQKVESRMYIPWSLTHGAKALNCASEDADSQWMPCQFGIAWSEDKCFRGSWIFARSPLHVSLMCYCFSSLAYNT